MKVSRPAVFASTASLWVASRPRLSPVSPIPPCRGDTGTAGTARAPRDPDSGGDGPERNPGDGNAAAGASPAGFRPRPEGGRAQGRPGKPGADSLGCTRSRVGSVARGDRAPHPGALSLEIGSSALALPRGLRQGPGVPRVCAAVRGLPSPRVGSRGRRVGRGPARTARTARGGRPGSRPHFLPFLAPAGRRAGGRAGGGRGKRKGGGPESPAGAQPRDRQPLARPSRAGQSGAPADPDPDPGPDLGFPPRPRRGAPAARPHPPARRPRLRRRPHGLSPRGSPAARPPARPLARCTRPCSAAPAAASGHEPPRGVVLSGFRSRDPEEGGDPGGRAEGGGQEEEEEEEEDAEAPVSVWDEEEDGATFTVTSRQYRPLDPLAPLPPPRSSRRLRAGTLEALVRYLLDARTSGVDVTFTPALLATHRAFTSTPALLGLVADRLEALESQPPGELERTTGVAISVLSTWLASHPEDFGSEVKGQLDRLESFLLRTGYAAQEGVGGGSADLIRNLRARVDPRAPNLPKPLALPGDSPADPTDVLVFLADHLAEQLTLLDAELFLNLIPSQCLGGLWGHRDRPGHSHLCPSVRATVTQFNKVAGAVVSSVLGATSIGEGPGEVTVRPLRPPQRARLLEKWIRVAEECRLLRNFSSVYAVVSALQSSPVHRLRAAWGEAARDSLRVFSSLCQIFSEEDNYSQSRELLTQEVKLQPPAEPHSKKAPRSGSRGGGVVPYLGTFLKDLVMLDAASKDELENGYINFDKRRKEFAVLSELLRLQNECRGYDLRPDPDIQQWLQGLQPLTEAQSHRVSCDVEPPGTSDSPAARMLRPTLVVSQWTEVLGSVGGPTPLVSWDRPSVGDEAPGTPAPLLTRLAQHMKWPSVSSLDSALESSPSLHGAAGPSHLSPPASSPRPSRGHRRSASCGSPLSGGTGEGASRSAGYGGGVSGPESSDCRIIRVQMELGEDGSVYKSILVTSQDKAPSVISRVLKKNNRDSAVASEFELVQLLPGERELTIPPSANVFYAMDGSSHDFLLRQRRRTSVATPGAHTGPSASGTPPSEGGGGSFPRIKATGRKIARALF
ncbi:ral guanine nucleotide dissociation stimulator-like 2 isoform X2 [Cricetulus griseus]|uniref:Ral guanine nucleotide dissociation stimulator-like 2 n=1 Tax=Cricetulus griseus TaxID=10029 RepID=A0A9J7KEE8_CRIGR|nr:ral guanine nucleotide dissociation stimulator-like 2 isoform X2 [Cricetulus griseus]